MIKVMVVTRQHGQGSFEENVYRDLFFGLHEWNISSGMITPN